MKPCVAVRFLEADRASFSLFVASLIALTSLLEVTIRLSF